MKQLIARIFSGPQLPNRMKRLLVTWIILLASETISANYLFFSLEDLKYCFHLEFQKKK